MTAPSEEETRMYARLRIVFMALVIGSALGVSGIGQGFALQVGEKAPLFELPSTTGESVKLADYLGKKPVVLFFYIGAFTNT
jgi:cytochrome oxidase Cu insertion factor (SCO1/SenC/PrrC family)